jgi:diaminopimelate epimerase
VTPRQTGSVRLSKHHGLGNDFLVIVDLHDELAIGPSLARAVCDRHTGLGADGLIHVGAGLTMTLLNADGSRAEMSGNGIRCLAHAMARAQERDHATYDIVTGAGVRRVEVRPGGRADEVLARVDMGAVSEVDVDPPDLDPAPKELIGADVGNPHVVALYADRAGVDAATDGLRTSERNVELVHVDGVDRLSMRVVERGVGETQACGTGACAAAWAARGWGLVGDNVTVAMPGGEALVELAEGVHLTGASVHVADVEFAWP